MNQKHGAAITIQKRVAIGEEPHDMAGAIRHDPWILTEPQSFIDSPLAIVGLTKINLAPRNGAVWECLSSILSGPGVQRLEEDSVYFEEILILDAAPAGEIL